MRSHFFFSTVKSRLLIREYFYYIDVHGQLFLHETTPKNITSCFKDKSFLDFFITRIVRNDKQNSYYKQGFHFKSPCGRGFALIIVDKIFSDLTACRNELYPS